LKPLTTLAAAAPYGSEKNSDILIQNPDMERRAGVYAAFLRRTQFVIATQ